MADTSGTPLCTRCATRGALHTLRSSDSVELLCCQCWINAAGPPADWHPECIKAFEARK